MLRRSWQKMCRSSITPSWRVNCPLGPGVIDAPIGRRGDSIIGRCVTPEGKPSRTEYTILRVANGLSLAACVPVTGRTHQIRRHFASIGHPLAGDDLYGGTRYRMGR